MMNFVDDGDNQCVNFWLSHKYVLYFGYYGHDRQQLNEVRFCQVNMGLLSDLK